jgi:Holliday junction resolvase
MPASWRRKGYDAERRLVKLLEESRGAYVFRIPVSGGRSNPTARTALPDVFMVDNAAGEVAAFEVKATGKSKVAIRAEQLVKLLKFLDAFKKYEKRSAVVAVWFAREGKWVFKRVKDSLQPTGIIVTCQDESDWLP